MQPSSIEAFWRHCQSLDAWCDHPIFKDPSWPLDRTIPLTIHGDGAQFFREDEMFVYSISSLFAPTGVIKDILLYKFPFMIIPERYMRSEAATLSAKLASVAEHPRSIWVDCEYMWMKKCEPVWVYFQPNHPCYRSIFSQNHPQVDHIFCFSIQVIPAMPAHAQVAKAVNKTAADLACWSIQCAMRGTAPEVGFRGEPLTGHHLTFPDFLKCGYPTKQIQKWLFRGVPPLQETLMYLYIYIYMLCFK